MRRKGMILSQNRYFHPVFESFAPWNPHQGSTLDPSGAHNAPKPPPAKDPQTILCPVFQFSKVDKYAITSSSKMAGRFPSLTMKL